MRERTIHDAPYITFEIAIKYRNEVYIPMRPQRIWDDHKGAYGCSRNIPKGGADVRKRRHRPVIRAPAEQPRVPPTLHLLRGRYKMLTIGPIFIVDAGCATVHILRGAARAAVRLPLACKVMAEVTVEFSTNFGVSDLFGTQFLFEAVEQVAPGALCFRY